MLAQFTKEKQMRRKKTWERSLPSAVRISLPVVVSVLIALAVALTLPMLIYGPMVKGDDTYEHLNYSHHFVVQFWQGEWSPRWLLGMNHGLGSPSLFIYPPFAYY